MSLLKQLRLAINEGLISQDLADKLSKGEATYEELSLCQDAVQDHSKLSDVWWYCSNLIDTKYLTNTD